MRFFERLHAWHRQRRVRWRADRAELDYILSRPLRGASVVDIGANRGVYSYWLHRCVGRTGRVIAFEPQPELCGYLRRLRHAFALHNLQVHNQALSSVEGSAEFSRPTDHWGGGSLERPPIDQIESIQVSLTTLDAFLAHRADVRPIRLIKCDVEGHELAVFRGAQNVLRQDRPELLFEAYHDKVVQGDLVGLLTDLGYVGFFFDRRQLVPLCEFSDRLPSLPLPFQNYLFVHRDAADHLPSPTAASSPATATTTAA